jgi:predicted Ser/Thr protein kinase
MNDPTDQDYQQQQLEQLKFETSQVLLNTIDDQSWTEQGINENIVQRIRSYIENGTKRNKLTKKFSMMFI